ncbi:MAG: glycosyltransferase [Notoacmeibacter sp.]|nr:glycosyltransferase [Notoacmeibacter sp.]
MHAPVRDNAGGAKVASPDTQEFEMAVRILRRLRVSPERAKRYLAQARQNGTSLQVEVLADPDVNETAYFAEMAQIVGLQHLSDLLPAHVLPYDRPFETVLSEEGKPLAAYYRKASGRLVLLLCPTCRQAAELAEFVKRHPAITADLAIVAPSDLRRAVLTKSADVLLARSMNRLFVNRPDFSARLVTNSWQSAALGALAIAIPVFSFTYPASASLVLHALSSLFFLSCVLIRTVAIPSAGAGYRPIGELPAVQDMPVYSVLVALYREDNIVGDLLVSLSRLKWPRSKLEIKLVCEEDDQATIEAVRAHALGSTVEIIEVPSGGPRTKPNALAYALQLCSGDLIVLYDAEDRPHPDQLLEAWSVFNASDESLACLQAPLVITNGAANRLAGMFAHEYAGLFRGLLPWLARHHLVMPLGGTSNHFRRKSLEDVLGWDPYNVTEDADLGLRLARLGYECATITRPTLEEAPDELSVWLGQRTRWMKGWMQCWLVHNRNILRLSSELKVKSFLVSQILLIGVILSVLIHPAAYVMMIYSLYEIYNSNGMEYSAWMLPLIDGASMFVAYLTFYYLGRAASTDTERRRNKAGILFVPVYWFLLSVAGWKAAYELFRRPHHWQKTPHKPLVSAQPSPPQLRI